MTTAAAQVERLTIAGPVGQLEALLEDPGGQAGAVAVVCHPHPLHGGTMQNKVVHTLARSFNRLGMPALRFNFRGVGASEGGYDNGDGERRDAEAVMDYAAARYPGRAIWLAGFSFGARVALAVASERPVDLLVTVAPPVGRMDMSGMPQPACRWLILQGDQDELVDADLVVEWLNTLEPGPELLMFEGADHFFHGRLVEMRENLLGLLGTEASET